VSKLEQIERLRKELVTAIVDITGLPIELITVDISLSIEEGEESDLAIEARDLGWYPDREQESAWYTSEIPQGGSTTVFTE
jgi:hypothetical protein